jgi:hypothetical protein
MRRKTAGVPAGKTFESWREHDSSISTPTQTGLATLEWVSRAANLGIAGPSGTPRPTSPPPASRSTPASRLSVYLTSLDEMVR